MQQIFDVVRRKYVARTPEEEVRQRTIAILQKDFSYPLTRFSVEAEIMVGKVKKRYDIIIRDSEQRPFMLIECKAPNVAITEETLAQATRYNVTLEAKYILLTNGKTTLLFKKEEQNYIQIKTIPELV